MNTAVFYIIGLYGILPTNVLLTSILSAWVIKVLVEVIFTPLTYVVVKALKKAEKVDHYDTHTNFNPFIIKAPF